MVALSCVLALDEVYAGACTCGCHPRGSIGVAVLKCGHQRTVASSIAFLALNLGKEIRRWRWKWHCDVWRVQDQSVLQIGATSSGLAGSIISYCKEVNSAGIVAEALDPPT